MKPMDEPEAFCPTDMSAEEWRLRLELAACYRLFVHLGWTEMIFNHITVRVPQAESDRAPQYLINPYGLHYSEVTASNLVKIDADGNKLDGSRYDVNPAGFVIHSAIHGARHDAQCIMHTHTTAGTSVATKAAGLRYDNFYAALVFGQVAYHDFEGVTTDADESGRLVASLGSHNVLILRNHGLLVCGGSVPAALETMWFLQRACEIQVASDAMDGPNLPIDTAVLQRNAQAYRPMALGQEPGRRMFDAILRHAGIRYADIA